MNKTDCLIKELIEQKECKFKGNIYHHTQVLFAYNSNHIEGSRLTEDQTEMIFSTNSFIAQADSVIKYDDVVEASNHFKLFDYMLEHYDEEISKNMILTMHIILKKGTSDEENPRYNVGGFKTVINEIGFINPIRTSKPENVDNDITALLDGYNRKEKKSFDDIMDFHFRFERIHPLSDGNGRVGRMLLFKECLRNKIMPFVILDKDKLFYIRGLREYDHDKNYLRDTLLNEQDIYDSICQQLGVFNEISGEGFKGEA